MRKHKSVVAILLAVMMIFTFMPTMAFAAENPTGVWNTTDYSSVKVGDTTYDKIAKTWPESKVYAGMNPVNGLVKADIDSSAYQGGIGFTLGNPAFYFDLNNSEINAADIWEHDTFVAAFDKEGKTKSGVDLGIKLKDPAGKVTTPVVLQNSARDGLNVVITATGFTADSYVDQTVTLTASVVPNANGEAVLSENVAKFIGSVPTKTIMVKAQKPAPDQVKLYKDEVKGANELVSSYPYDGETHKVVTNNVPGYEVSFKVQNPKTKVYEDAAAVEFKDAGTVYFSYTITKTADKTTTGPIYDSVQVTAATDGFRFGFDSSVAGNNKWTKVPEATNPVDFVNVSVKDSDKEEAMKYFADRYEIKATANKADASLVTWTISQKADYDSEAVGKTYKTLLDNYSTDGTLINNARVATVTLVAPTPEVNDKDDDITFTGVTTKSYKAKKKTKKLAKAKSFQVAATAASGNAVTFTATSSNAKVSIDATGKVTVKKGLKKGTKVKLVVKARTEAGNGYKAVSAEKAYTIKIK